MATIYDLSLSCHSGFVELLSSLRSTKSQYLELMSESTIQGEFGKFKVWCSNLGALQLGFMSLDYRLNESTVMYSNVIRLLKQLETAIAESVEVISGMRLPFDEQSIPSDISDESSDEPSLAIADNSEQKELTMRAWSITDIQRNLYQLSYKIRDPSLRPISNKAAVIKRVDDETGVDLFDILSEYDRRHLEELLRGLRDGRTGPNACLDFLFERLLASSGIRRKNFRYWSHHARKLGYQPKPAQKTLDKRKDKLVGSGSTDTKGKMREVSITDRSTILSHTNATPYDAIRDDETEKQTVISFASTAIDIDGKGIVIPNAPPEALKDKPFVCPYCGVLCPPSQGRGKAWRSHVLHDLQPYVCTYKECKKGDKLYETRNTWLEHEATTHRCSWRCRDHPDILYASLQSFEEHLQLDHGRQLSPDQTNDVVRMSALGGADDREFCPVCFARQPFPRGLTNHLANHLERIALFSLPMTAPSIDSTDMNSQFSNQADGDMTCSTTSLNSHEPALEKARAIAQQYLLETVEPPRLFGCPFYMTDQLRYHECGRDQLRRLSDVYQHIERRHLLQIVQDYESSKRNPAWEDMKYTTSAALIATYHSLCRREFNGRDAEHHLRQHVLNNNCQPADIGDTGLLLPDEFRNVLTERDRVAGSVRKWYAMWRQCFSSFKTPFDAIPASPYLIKASHEQAEKAVRHALNSYPLTIEEQKVLCDQLENGTYPFESITDFEVEQEVQRQQEQQRLMLEQEESNTIFT